MKKILHEQQKQFEKSQIYLLIRMTQLFYIEMVTQSTGNLIPNDSVDLIANNIPDFIYDPENNIFSLWFKCWRATFEHNFSHKDDTWKLKLLLRKLGSTSVSH